MKIARGALYLLFGIFAGGFLVAAWADQWDLAGKLGLAALAIGATDKAMGAIE